ncbi:MAG TPA: hypothetical protein VHL11_05860, partial [Phototrophicaceae bacterium]|nr:hypothetical protein [Phototrophicaceae bacterium]
MIQLDLAPEDLHLTRFAYSPLVELSTGYRMLKDTDVQHHFPRWMAVASEAFSDLEFPYLEGLIPRCGYIPDFLTPTPTRTDLTIEHELQKLMNTPTSVIQDGILKMIDLVGDSEIRQ